MDSAKSRSVLQNVSKEFTFIFLQCMSKTQIFLIEMCFSSLHFHGDQAAELLTDFVVFW